nr:uncharacterized protein LOC113804563 [Penaeus vannamei]
MSINITFTHIYLRKKNYGIDLRSQQPGCSYDYKSINALRALHFLGDPKAPDAGPEVACGGRSRRLVPHAPGHTKGQHLLQMRLRAKISTLWDRKKSLYAFYERGGCSEFLMPGRDWERMWFQE